MVPAAAQTHSERQSLPQLRSEPHGASRCPDTQRETVPAPAAIRAPWCQPLPRHTARDSPCPSCDQSPMVPAAAQTHSERQSLPQLRSEPHGASRCPDTQRETVPAPAAIRAPWCQPLPRHTARDSPCPSCDQSPMVPAAAQTHSERQSLPQLRSEPHGASRCPDTQRETVPAPKCSQPKQTKERGVTPRSFQLPEGGNLGRSRRQADDPEPSSSEEEVMEFFEPLLRVLQGIPIPTLSSSTDIWSWFPALQNLLDPKNQTSIPGPTAQPEKPTADSTSAPKTAASPRAAALELPGSFQSPSSPWYLKSPSLPSRLVWSSPSPSSPGHQSWLALSSQP
ncbi:hypothetical protein UY3_15043 [Chelonia mydas]|uniref:Uncharacterized protein n=1 Tax=Chelonia mydas TaxID=8469 RepID=M7ARD0_CHEMY|nr:hypothetical protein UY3_15043 [Chelonia mydas]